MLSAYTKCSLNHGIVAVGLDYIYVNLPVVRIHITPLALGSHRSDGDEHEATVSPTRNRPMSQW